MTHLSGARDVLEIGSGTGQHAVYFARHMPHLRWQPTDLRESIPGLVQRLNVEGPKNVLAPLELDVANSVWPVESVDAIFSANTLHIMAWANVEDFFAGARRVLSPGGLLCVYGPFRYGVQHTSDSNAAFDLSLTRNDPLSGIRDFFELERLAAEQELGFVVDYELPANNRLLVWARPSAT